MTTTVQYSIKPRYLDYTELNKLDRDGKITEIIGQVFYNHAAPTTWHQIISMNVGTILSKYLDRKRVGILFDAPTDIILSEDDVVQPDFLFIRKNRKHIIKEHGIIETPDLIIEIISDESYDIKKKMPLYARYGLVHLWYIFPDEQMIKIYKLKGGHYELKKAISKQDSFKHILFPGLTVKASKVFRKF